MAHDLVRAQLAAQLLLNEHAMDWPLLPLEANEPLTLLEPALGRACTASVMAVEETA